MILKPNKVEFLFVLQPLTLFRNYRNEKLEQEQNYSDHLSRTEIIRTRLRPKGPGLNKFLGGSLQQQN